MPSLDYIRNNYRTALNICLSSENYNLNDFQLKFKIKLKLIHLGWFTFRIDMIS